MNRPTKCISWWQMQVGDWHYYELSYIPYEFACRVLTTQHLSEDVLMIGSIGGGKQAKRLRKKDICNYQVLSSKPDIDVSLIPTSELYKFTKEHELFFADCPHRPTPDQLELLRGHRKYEFVERKFDGIIPFAESIRSNLLYFFDDDWHSLILTKNPAAALDLVRKYLEKHYIDAGHTVALSLSDAQIQKLMNAFADYPKVSGHGITIENNKTRIRVWDYRHDQPTASRFCDAVISGDEMTISDWSTQIPPDYIHEPTDKLREQIGCLVGVLVPLSILYGLYKLVTYLLSLL